MSLKTKIKEKLKKKVLPKIKIAVSTEKVKGVQNLYKIKNKGFNFRQLKRGVVLRTAPWCGSCKGALNTLKKLAPRFKNTLPFYIVDITNLPLPGFSIPTFFIVDNTQKKKKFVLKEGLMDSSEMLSWLNKNGVKSKGIKIAKL